MAEDTTTQNTKKEMTTQEAQEILSASSFVNYSYDELLEAVRLLRDDPTQKDLVAGFYEHYYASFEGKEITADEYLELREIFAGSDYEQELKQRIDDQNEDSEDEEFLPDTEIQIDSELVNQNAAEIDRIISAESAPREFWEDPQMAELAKAISFPLEDKNGNVVEADDEQKQAYLESIYYSAAAQVMQDNLNNSDFAALSKEQKAEYIKKEITTQASTDILTMYIATGVSNTLVREKLEEIVPDLPKAPESKNPTKEEIDGYNKAMSSKLMEAMKDPQKAEEIAAKFNEAMETVAKAEGKIKISPMQLMANQTDKQVDLGIKSRRLFKASKKESVDVRKTAIILRRYENKLSEIGKKLYGKVYNFAVGVKEFAHNEPGKAIETLGQLVITGGNMGMAAMSHFGHGGGSAVASGLALTMVAHTFAKGVAYPVYNEWQILKNDEAFRKLNWWQKYKTARKIAKEKDPDLNGHLIVGGVALVAWGVGNMALGPMGGKIAASATIALGNAIMKQREFNRVKKLYELTGEEKYRKELYGDKSKPAKGFWGKLQKLMGSKKTQATMAWVGALAGGLGVASQIYKHAHETAEVVTSLSGKNLDHIPTSRADSLAQGGIKADSLQQDIRADSLAQGGIKADSLQQGALADGKDIASGAEAGSGTADVTPQTEAHTAGADTAIELGGKFQKAVNIEMKFGAHSDSWFDSRSSLSKFDNIIIRDAADGGNEELTAQEFLNYAKAVGGEGLLEGKPEGMSVSEYVYRYNMLREQVGFSGNLTEQRIQLNKELLSLGFKAEDWSRFLRGDITQAEADKLFQTHLGPHLARSLIDRDINCGKVNVVQQEIIHRGLATIDTSGEVYGKSGYYVGAGHVRPGDNHWTGNEAHYHIDDDCSGKGDLHQANIKNNVGAGDDIVRKENISRDIKFDDNNQVKKTNLPPIEQIPVETPPDTVIENLKVSYAAEPEGALAEYPSAFAGKGTYPNIDSEGYRIDAIDRGGNGLTAKEVNAPDNRLGLKLTNGDKAQLTVTDANGTSTQDSRFVNIRDPYTGVDSETVAKAAADLGGKPEEIITVTDNQGKTTYQYISNEGIKMTIDPENGSMGITTLDGKGAPQDVQVEAANRAVEALNSSDAKVRVEQMDAPAQKSALTKITTKVKGNKVLQNIYARFSGGRS